jgi:short-subunit dehydrogenase
MDLQGAHCVLTGASRGIGAVTARELSRRGAHVTVVARSEDKLKVLAEEINGTAFRADLSDEDDVNGLIDRIESAVRPVDILINNAAAISFRKFSTLTAAEVRQIIQVNLLGSMELCRQALPGMLQRDRGRLVNIAAMAGLVSMPGVGVYGATKSGLIRFTASLRHELKATNVGTMIVPLGEIQETDMIEAARENPTVHGFIARFNRMRVLPYITPQDVALRVAEGLEKDRAELLIPRRLAPLYRLHELPTSMMKPFFVGLPG